MKRTAGLVVLTLVLGFSCAAAQENSQVTKPDAAKPGAAPEKKPLSITSRLNAAKTAYVKKGGGNSIPYDVISTAVEGWGRFIVVNEPEKSDITIEVMGPDESSGVTMTSNTTDIDRTTGHPEQKSSTTRNVGGTNGPVKMNVYETKTHMLLFIASENPGFAMKSKTRENNIADAAGRVMAKFRDRVEPPPSPEAK